jgi:hypothetical protein
VNAFILNNALIELAFSRDGDALLATRLTNRATGFNWVASGTPVGPYLVRGERALAGIEASGGFTSAGHKQDKTETGEERL